MDDKLFKKVGKAQIKMSYIIYLILLVLTICLFISGYKIELYTNIQKVRIALLMSISNFTGALLGISFSMIYMIESKKKEINKQ